MQTSKEKKEIAYIDKKKKAVHSVFMPSTFVYSFCSCIVLKAFFVALFDLVRGRRIMV